jgi:hypothetical protein
MKKTRRPEDPAGGKPLAEGVSGRLNGCAVMMILNLDRKLLHQLSDFGGSLLLDSSAAYNKSVRGGGRFESSPDRELVNSAVLLLKISAD